MDMEFWIAQLFCHLVWTQWRPGIGGGCQTTNRKTHIQTDNMIMMMTNDLGIELAKRQTANLQWTQTHTAMTDARLKHMVSKNAELRRGQF